jgi:hypothetical protein
MQDSADMSWTYEKPDAQAYLHTLVKYLEQKGERQIADLLRDSKCVIHDSGSFSGDRWNAHYTTVNFYVPLDKLEYATQETAEKLVPFCKKIMPEPAGLDVKHIEFSPLLESVQAIDMAVTEIENIVTDLSQENMARILPEDIKENGKEMAGVYLYLYCIENSLRLFVETVGKDAFGEDYFSSIKIGGDVRRKVDQRRVDATKKKWLPARGTSDIFYLDFSDLGSVIGNNWALFSRFFPDLNWIVTKINELSDCRNLVAHNSFLESDQRALIKVYYGVILKQLSESLESQREK